MTSINTALIAGTLASLLAISGCAGDAAQQEELVTTGSSGEVEEPHPGLTPYFENCASCHNESGSCPGWLAC